MTTRREAERIFTLFMSAAVLMLLCILGLATYLTLNPPPPMKFTPPAIWSEPHRDSTPPGRTFDI